MTEDVVYMLHGMGIDTGIDLPTLISAAQLIESLVGRPVPSGVAHHGARLASVVGEQSVSEGRVSGDRGPA